jgi:hypothetical protein
LTIVTAASGELVSSAGSVKVKDFTVAADVFLMGVFSCEDSNGSLEVDKVAPFLLKLYEIVSSPVSDDLVCWSEHGETFKIVNRTKFAGDVLPLYFKHDNLRSFIRQLNIYGFQRCTNAPG